MSLRATLDSYLLIPESMTDFKTMSTSLKVPRIAIPSEEDPRLVLIDGRGVGPDIAYSNRLQLEVNPEESFFFNVTGGLTFKVEGFINDNR